MPPTHIKESNPAAEVSGRPAGTRPASERVVSTKELLGGAHRIWIEHAAERYLLTVTRNGKLILTK
jgi:hemin uptake protein HemP